MSIRAVVTSSASGALTVSVARLPDTLRAGQFFLARCETTVPTPILPDSVTHPPDGSRLTPHVSDDFSPYLRRPLFPTRIERVDSGWRVTFHLIDQADEGYAWLASRIEGEEVDLLGPYGNGFDLQGQSRSLLLAADATSAPLLYPLMETMLDRGGRVSLLLRGETGELGPLLSNLPFAAEARVESAATWSGALTDMVRWADQLMLALPVHDYAQAASLVRSARLHPVARFAQALVRTPLPCGVGACLACIVPLAKGRHTRACIHGPVFDLFDLG